MAEELIKTDEQTPVGTSLDPKVLVDNDTISLVKNKKTGAMGWYNGDEVLPFNSLTPVKNKKTGRYGLVSEDGNITPVSDELYFKAYPQGKLVKSAASLYRGTVGAVEDLATMSKKALGAATEGGYAVHGSQIESPTKKEWEESQLFKDIDFIVKNTKDYAIAQGIYKPENMPQGVIEELAYGLLEFTPSMLTSFPVSGGGVVTGLSARGLEALGKKFGPAMTKRISNALIQKSVKFAASEAATGVSMAAGAVPYALATDKDVAESAAGFAIAGMVLKPLVGALKYPLTKWGKKIAEVKDRYKEEPKASTETETKPVEGTATVPPSVVPTPATPTATKASVEAKAPIDSSLRASVISGATRYDGRPGQTHADIIAERKLTKVDEEGYVTSTKEFITKEQAGKGKPQAKPTEATPPAKATETPAINYAGTQVKVERAIPEESALDVIGKQEEANVAKAKQELPQATGDHAKDLTNYLEATGHDMDPKSPTYLLKRNKGIDTSSAEIEGAFPGGAGELVEPTKNIGTTPKEGLVVSLLDKEGKHYMGNPGENHGDLYERVQAKEPNKVFSFDVGFTDASGKFLSKDQAAKVAADQKLVKPESEGVQLLGSEDLAPAVGSPTGVSPVEARVKAEATEVPAAPSNFIEPRAFKEARVEKPAAEIEKDLVNIKKKMDALRKDLVDEVGNPDDVYDKLDQLEDEYRLYNKSRSGSVGQIPKLEKPTLYTELKKVISEKVPDSAEPYVIKRILDNPKNSVNEAELEELGLKEWLSSLKPNEKISKQSLEDFIKSQETKLYSFGGQLTGHLEQMHKDIVSPLVEIYTRPPQTNELKKIIGPYLGDVQRYGKRMGDFLKVFNKEFDDPLTRRAMSRALEADSDAKTLTKWRDSIKDEGLKKVYDKALNLSAKEKEMVRQVRVLFDEGWESARKEGILTDEAWIDNYFAHIGIERSNAVTGKFKALVNAGVLRDRPSFSKRRLFDTLFDLEQAGFTQRSGADEIGSGLVAWQKSLAEAIAAKEALKSMSTARMPDGRNVIYIPGIDRILPANEAAKTPAKVLVKPNMQGKDTHDYVPRDYPQISKMKWIGKDTAGNPVLMEGRAYIHPDAVGKIDALLGKNWFQEYTIPKSWPVIGDTRPFARMQKIQSFIKGTMMIGPFHQFTVAEHAIFHGVNPFRAPALNLEGALERELVNGGMMVFETHGAEHFGEGTGSSRGLLQLIGDVVKATGESHLSKDNIARTITDKADFLKRYQEWLFKDFIPRLKMAMAKKAVGRAEKWYAKELASGELTRVQMIENVANQSNAAFGEQNYKYMGRNPTLQGGLRLAFLAPDFLESRLRFGGQALKPYGREQQKALIQGAIITATAMQTLNIMFGDKHEANWTKPFTFTIGGKDWTPRSVIGDAWHLGTDQRGFLLWRLSPIYGRGAFEVATGRDVSGKALSADEIVKDISSNWSPLPMQPYLKRGFQDTKESAILSGIFQAMGISNYKSISKAERLLYDMHRAQDLPLGGYTAEQKQKMKDRNKLRADYKEGVINGDDLSYADLKAVTEKTPEEEFKRLISRRTPIEVLKAWKLMTKQEKEDHRDAVIQKIVNSTKLTGDEMEAAIEEVGEDE